MHNYTEIFDKSFDRIMGKEQDAFFDRFYAIFTSKSGAIKEKFDAVPPNRRKPMVRSSLVELMDYYCTQKVSDTMEEMARYHSKGGADIHPKMYMHWQESLLQAVEEFDPEFSSDVDAAWRVIVSPGIAFMIHKWAS